MLFRSNDTATTEIYTQFDTLSLHDALPISEAIDEQRESLATAEGWLFKYLGWYQATRSPEAVRRDIERVAARRAADLGVTLG